GHENLAALAGEVLAHPRAVGAHLDGHPRSGMLRRQLRERLPRVGQGSLIDKLSCLIEDAVVVSSIAEVDADCGLWDVIHNKKGSSPTSGAASTPSHSICSIREDLV